MKGASSSAATSAPPKAASGPATATRISGARPGRPPGWRSRSGRHTAGRSRRPTPRPARRATTPRARGTSDGVGEGRPSRHRRPAQRPEGAPSIAYRRSWPGRSGTERTSAHGLSSRSRRREIISRLVSSCRAGDIVGRRCTALEDELDGRAVVVDVQPVAPLETVAIEGQRLVVDRVRHEQRDHLLRVLVRTEVVRAGDADRQPVSGRVRVARSSPPALLAAYGLRGRSAASSSERPFSNVAIDLIGADLDESLVLVAAGGSVAARGGRRRRSHRSGGRRPAPRCCDRRGSPRRS